MKSKSAPKQEKGEAKITNEGDLYVLPELGIVVRATDAIDAAKKGKEKVKEKK